jgi:hypothetical protein
MTEEPPQGFANAADALRTRANSETDAATKADMLASAAAFEKIDAQTRQLHKEVLQARDRAKALEPSAVRLIAHFVLLSVIALLASLLTLRFSLHSWGAPSYLWPAAGILVAAALLAGALYCGSKVAAPQPERLKFSRSLPRWLAPMRPSLLIIVYSIAAAVILALLLRAS